MGKANELTFQNDMIRQLVANGWLLGKPEDYNRGLALYEEDLLGFVKETQDKQWQKFCKLYPNNPEQKLSSVLERLKYLIRSRFTIYIRGSHRFLCIVKELGYEVI